jgi:type III restriction enzyme
MTYEVEQPILNNPFDEPNQYWFIRQGYTPEKRSGRRPAIAYPPKDTDVDWDTGDQSVLKKSSYEEFAPGYTMTLVNQLREKVKEWRDADYSGATRVTKELLEYWYRQDRAQRLFFAQKEAVTTIIFLQEADPHFRQGIKIPLDQPQTPDQTLKQTIQAFTRYACKMATGSGKTTVMAMLAAWSILNKVTYPRETKFSDTVLVVCPNITIKSRLQELIPHNGAGSIYRTRDIVPPHYMELLRRGKVLITNWHIFEKQTPGNNDAAKVIKTGILTNTTKRIKIGAKNETARGIRYLTLESLQQQEQIGAIEVIKRYTDSQGNLIEVKVKENYYVESDAAWIKRILTKEIGDKGNILVFNDEAHHAYRIVPNAASEKTDPEDEQELYETKEATIWIEGLDRIHQHRKINFCVDLSATPYYLKSANQNTNKPFEWIVSDFSLMDAIESGLVKIPQLPVRDTTGADISDLAYFNIWQSMLKKMNSSERGKGVSPKPEAVLKYVQHPIILLGKQWEEVNRAWSTQDEPEIPVFIIVCKNTKIAKCLYDWIAENIKPESIPPCDLLALRNHHDNGTEIVNTIRIDSKVVEELESGNSKTDETKWMRFTLDTIGKKYWHRDSQGRDIYPEGFIELATKLHKPIHPPGRDIKCVISVGMLTEGWDCCTVKQIIGIRPFQSQLLCEQVVGRALRRVSYDLDQDEQKFTEESATIFGVPFEVVPFKANPAGVKPKPEVRYHVHTIPQKQAYRLEFPIVTGYTQAVRNKVNVDWENIAGLTIDPFNIPPEVQVKSAVHDNQGRPTLSGPGRLKDINLNPYRAGKRFQELVFQLAAALTQKYCQPEACQAPAHILFPQLVQICHRYLTEKVTVIKPNDILDVFISPYYGWMIENLSAAIQPDTSAGEAPEIPTYDIPNGSTDSISFFTSKTIREVIKCHLNCVVADTGQWEQAAAYIIDNHPATQAFAKNERLGFYIPYYHNDSPHDYLPDFIIRLNTAQPNYLILETKGYDKLKEVKQAAAHRWCNAVNALGKWGHWQYVMTELPRVKPTMDQIWQNISA